MERTELEHLVANYVKENSSSTCQFKATWFISLFEKSDNVNQFVERLKTTDSISVISDKDCFGKALWALIQKSLDPKGLQSENQPSCKIDFPFAFGLTSADKSELAVLPDWSHQHPKTSSRRILRYFIPGKVIFQYEHGLREDCDNSSEEDLDTSNFKTKLLAAAESTQILIVKETFGRRLSPMIAQCLLSAGYGNEKKIFCVEPNRATVLLADNFTSGLVGYCTVFESCNEETAKLIYVTTELFLRMLSQHGERDKFSIIIFDAFSQNHLYSETAIILLKQLLHNLSDTKLIVVSGETNDEKYLSNYLNNATVLSSVCRCYPVGIYYAMDSITNHVDAVTETIIGIVNNVRNGLLTFGGILAYVTTPDEVVYCTETLKRQLVGDSLGWWNDIMSIHNNVTMKMTIKGLDFSRKIAVSTQAAEYFAFPGIKFIVDIGFRQEYRYDSKSNLECVHVENSSKESCNRRAQQAGGQFENGICFRLFSIDNYRNTMRENDFAEIESRDLTTPLLLLAQQNIDVFQAKFINAVPEDALVAGLVFLEYVGATTLGKITAKGNEMATIPCDSRMAKSLLIAQSLNCLSDVLVMLSMLNFKDTLFREKQPGKTFEIRQRFMKDQRGDHFVFLNIYLQWQMAGRTREWCSQNELDFDSMFLVSQYVEKLRKSLPSVNSGKRIRGSTSDEADGICKSIIAGYFQQTATFVKTNLYKIVGTGEHINIDSQSCMFGKLNRFVLFHEIVTTGGRYMSEVLPVEEEWILEMAKKFFEENVSNDSH